MKKSQIIFLVIGIILIGALFSLPTIVVDNSDQDIVMEETGEAAVTPSIAETHETALSPAAREQVNTLRAGLENEEDSEKYVILADSIGKVYQDSDKLNIEEYFYLMLV